MRHELRVFEGVDELAHSAAAFIARCAKDAVERDRRFTLALSGGRTPRFMLAKLAVEDVAWNCTTVFQVDERVAPEGSDLRNVTHLRDALAPTAATLVEMPVGEIDLDAAARDYAALLPSRLDLVHLGLGVDGHCASLVANDPVLEVTDRLVAPSGPYQGTRRLTLTFPALARAEQLLWLVSGQDKREVLARLLQGDVSIPAGRVQAAHSLVMADRDACQS